MAFPREDFYNLPYEKPFLTREFTYTYYIL